MLFRTPIVLALTLAATGLFAACEAPLQTGVEDAQMDAGPNREASVGLPQIDPNLDLLVRKITICAKTEHCSAASGKLQLNVSTHGAPHMRGCSMSTWYDDELLLDGGPALEEVYACQKIHSELDQFTGQDRNIWMTPSPPLADPDPNLHFEPSADIALTGSEVCTTLPLVDIRDVVRSPVDDEQRAPCAAHAQAHSLPTDEASLQSHCKLIPQARFVYPARALGLDGLSLTVGGQKIEARLDSVDFGRASAHATFDCQKPKPAQSAAVRLNELLLRESVHQIFRPSQKRAKLQAHVQGRGPKRLPSFDSAQKLPLSNGAEAAR